VASRPDPRRSRLLLAAWLAGAFALSAARDLLLLLAAGVLAGLLFRRGFRRALGRTLRTVVPGTAVLTALSFLWLRAMGGDWPPAEPFAALFLRAAVIGFTTFAVLDRVDLLGALAPFPVLSRLLVVTLAQIHALRLLSTESLQGLRSRMPRRPGALDLVRGAGGITAALYALAVRNARDIGDAMRSRGFS
jgi:cobalt/nickel transport system permease protein